MGYSSLVDLWLKKAESNSHASYHYLRNAETLETSLTHAELTREAKRLAGWLIDKGFSGERAMLAFPPGIEFVVAFMACVMAKVIAVPVAPAPLSGDKNKVRRIISILRDCQPALVMGVTQTIEKAPLFVEDNPEFNHVTWFKLDEFTDGHVYDHCEITAPVADDIALLQYTSGSTSQPKGVILTHKNVLHNLSMWAHELGHDANSKMVCWVPHFHDLGLLYGILLPLYEGISVVLLPAAAVVQKPTRWLQAISDYRGTHSMGPNFIYQHCVDRVTDEEVAGLDLSSWRMGLNAAEPIRIETVEAFNKKFAPCGLDPRTVTPAYGLAESTCLMTNVRWDVPIRAAAISAAALNSNKATIATAGEVASHIVACGHPALDMTVKIVDPVTCIECPVGSVGEIWASSPSSSTGYWKRPQESLATFGAKIVGDASDTVYVRTGDLGFFEGGDVFTTGRVKDLIIIRGENYYPQDAEWVIEQAHPAFKPSCCAVFSVEGETEEKLVVVQELIRHWDRWDFDDMYAAVRRSVGAVYDLPIESIVLIRPGTTSKTSSGKIQRGASKKLYLNDELQVIARWDRHPVVKAEAPVITATANDIETFLIQRIAEVAALSLSSIDPVRPFADYGLGSVDSTLLADEISKRFSLQVLPTAFYDFPSIRQLAKAVTHTPSEQVTTTQEQPAIHDDMIVVVGMACRFPGANSLADYWNVIREGHVTTSTKITADGQVRHGGFLEDITGFDNDFFAITNREASCVDPQQRMALEVSWHALEDAGVVPSALSESATGVFFGASSFDYGSLQFAQGTLDSYSCQGSVLAVIANRIAYHFDLRGPSFVVDTACSSALTSLHLACRSLRDKECNMALAGAVNLIAAEDWDSALKKAGMLSPDGACKTFDASANGYVRGEGCGVLVLKRYADALRDGDRIYGSILGTAINQDGRSNGLTAPNGNAQEALLKNALSAAKVSADELGYIEAHGTGTPLGDPIECRALGRVLGARKQPCFVGSVKGNIGHLEAAAGMAGIIKTLLSVHHGVIPAQANFKQANPLIEFGAQLAISLNTTVWPKTETERRVASVSAFGFSGSNACALVGSVPQALSVDMSAHLPEALPFVLSAQDAPALRRMAHDYAAFLSAMPEQKWSDFIHTLTHHREVLPARFFSSALHPQELIASLNAFAQTEARENVSSHPLKLAFAFSEFDHLPKGFAHALYKHSEVFRAALNEASALIERLTEINLIDVLYGDASDVLLSDARVIYPATFSLQYAFFKVLAAFGVRADAVLGFGIGDYAALVAAGSMSLDAAIKLVVARGDIAHQTAANPIALDIYANEQSVQAAIEKSGLAVQLSAVVSRHHCVVVADVETLAAFTRFMQSELIEHPKMPAPPAQTSLLIPVEVNAQQQDRKTLDVLLLRLLKTQLGSLGLFDAATASVAEWKKTIQFPALYDAWLEQSIDVLISAGMITRTSEKLASASDDGDPWHDWALHKSLWINDQQMRAQVVLVDTVLTALPSIIRSEKPATSVMFPNGSFHLVEGIYKNTALSDYYNSVLSEGLIAYIESHAERYPGKKIRIIEIGAGTGGTSALLFDALKNYQHHIDEYCFTDISNAFLLHAREKFLQKAPYLVTRLFNIESDLVSQDMEAGSYDILVATNVLHATKDMRTTLRNCKALLKQEGRLLINEISDFNVFTHLTFGMLEGWWLYTDKALRVKGCPALSPDSWRDLLHAEGFAQVRLPAQSAHHLGQQIIAAQSDGITPLAATQLPNQGTAFAAVSTEAKAFLTDLANSQNYFPPTTPFISQVTGQLLPAGTRVEGSYFVGQWQSATHYSESLSSLEHAQISLVLEIGATAISKTVVRQQRSPLASHWAIAGDTQGDSWVHLLNALGRVFTEGGKVNWSPVFGDNSLAVMSLPPYAFAKKSHWFQRDEAKWVRQTLNFSEADSFDSLSETDAVETHALSIDDSLTEMLARLIQVAPEHVNRQQTFFEMGVDSISLMEFASAVTAKYGVQLTISEIFEDYPCIHLVSKKLEDILNAEEAVS